MFKRQDLQMFGLKLDKNMSNCHTLEVERHGSETEYQVGEKLNNVKY